MKKIISKNISIKKRISCYMLKKGGGLIYSFQDVPSDIRGVVKYYDSLYSLFLPAESGLVK